MSPDLYRMYASVGSAVIYSQVFEAIMSITHQMLGMIETSTSAPIDVKKFKSPTKNIVKALSHANNIAPEFADEIDALLEKRHELVHRWFTQNGIPSEEDTAGVEKLLQLATEVEVGCKRITVLLTGYMLRWGRQMGTNEAGAESSATRLLAVFRRAHLGEVEEP